LPGRSSGCWRPLAALGIHHGEGSDEGQQGRGACRRRQGPADRDLPAAGQDDLAGGEYPQDPQRPERRQGDHQQVHRMLADVGPAPIGQPDAGDEVGDEDSQIS